MDIESGSYPEFQSYRPEKKESALELLLATIGLLGSIAVLILLGSVLQ